MRRDDGWQLDLTFVEQDDVLVLRELHIKPARQRKLPPKGLTADLLKAMTTTNRLRELARQSAARIANENADLKEPWRVLLRDQRGRPRGRGGRPKTFYAQLAIDLDDLRARNVSNPILTLAQDRHLQPSTIRGHLRKARALGYRDKDGRATAAARRAVTRDE